MTMRRGGRDVIFSLCVEIWERGGVGRCLFSRGLISNAQPYYETWLCVGVHVTGAFSVRPSAVLRLFCVLPSIVRVLPRKT